jgi:hypothetical protein
MMQASSSGAGQAQPLAVGFATRLELIDAPSGAEWRSPGIVADESKSSAAHRATLGFVTKMSGIVAHCCLLSASSGWQLLSGLRSQSAGPIGRDTRRMGLLPQSCAGKLPISKSVGRFIRRVMMPCLRAHGCAAVREARGQPLDGPWTRRICKEVKRRTASRRGPGGGDDVKPSA